MEHHEQKLLPKFIILKQSPWVTKVGCCPYCIVLTTVKKGKRKEFTTHEMVNRHGKKEFYSGHYFGDDEKERAEDDFKKRVNRM